MDTAPEKRGFGIEEHLAVLSAQHESGQLGLREGARIYRDKQKSPVDFPR